MPAAAATHARAKEPPVLTAAPVNSTIPDELPEETDQPLEDPLPAA